MVHVRIQSANIEPVFFAYPDVEETNRIVANVVAEPAEYDFVAPDGFGHHFWPVSCSSDIVRITEIFACSGFLCGGRSSPDSASRIGGSRTKSRESPSHRK